MLSSLLTAVACLAAPIAMTDRAPPTCYETPAEPVAQGRIDELVFGRLKKLKIRPARPCSDAVFLRRAFVDVIGTLPTAEEARPFLESEQPQKRAALVEQLLQRPEFADYWAMKWDDLLRVKAEFPINLWPNAVQGYHRWIYAALRDDRPYDQFVRALLTSHGSSFRVPPVNFYRAVQDREPEGLAQAVALTFMGCRTEKWPQEQRAGMAACFSRLTFKSTLEWKEEIVFFDSGAKAGPGANSSPQAVVLPDGTQAALPPDRDPREVFADWLIRPENPWFTQNIVNRIWYWLLGRGIIHEPDDARPDNPPGNPALLAWLQEELVRGHYDLKHVFRLVLNSQTYQLSALRRSDRPEAEANFAFYPLRRLEAEVLIDAINQVTGTNDRYSSPIPEPFTFIPEKQRAIALADGSVTSSFLELFGRSPRDTGLEAERNNRPTAAQRLHLLNSSHVYEKLEGGPSLQRLAQGKGGPEEMVRELYLTILSRYPTDDELKRSLEYSHKSKAKSRDVLLDLAWALINSEEFLHRH